MTGMNGILIAVFSAKNIPLFLTGTSSAILQHRSAPSLKVDSWSRKYSRSSRGQLPNRSADPTHSQPYNCKREPIRASSQYCAQYVPNAPNYQCFAPTEDVLEIARARCDAGKGQGVDDEQPRLVGANVKVGYHKVVGYAHEVAGEVGTCEVRLSMRGRMVIEAVRTRVGG